MARSNSLAALLCKISYTKSLAVITTLSISPASHGKGTLAAIHHNADGFNQLEIATRLRTDISAFQDRISDFTVSSEDVTANPVKPHEWAFLNNDSITINLTRTADSGNATWTM